MFIRCKSTGYLAVQKSKSKPERKKILLLFFHPNPVGFTHQKTLLLVSIFSFSFVPVVYYSHIKLLGLHGSTADYQGIAAAFAYQDGSVMCPQNQHNVIIECAPE